MYQGRLQQDINYGSATIGLTPTRFPMTNQKLVRCWLPRLWPSQGDLYRQ